MTAPAPEPVEVLHHYTYRGVFDGVWEASCACGVSAGRKSIGELHRWYDEHLSAPEPVEVAADELAAAESRTTARGPESKVEYLRGVFNEMPGTWINAAVLDVLDEHDRMRAELTKSVADCGICKLGGRTLYINDDCRKHGDCDGISW